ncbi:MAG TPA: DEAD/DEAH box helicase [Oligoflexia bacterium]|nr:DEAD/DEAH box helicase [Oligoflexia bacterium]
MHSRSSRQTAENTGNFDIDLHPFSCTREELLAELEALEFAPPKFGEIAVFLPSDALGPFASPKLAVAKETERSSSPELRLWRIIAAELTPVEAVNFLCSLPHPLPEGLRLDSSIKFWREPTKLLLELLSRGRFIPGIVRKNKQWFSHWHLIPSTEEDRTRLTVLAESMPPLCRAVWQKEQSKPVQPSVLIESFITVCGDALIRSFLMRDSFLEDPPKTPLSARHAVPCTWIASLTKQTGDIHGPEYELLKFEQQLRKWAGSLLISPEGHQLRTVFRLIPPRTGLTDRAEAAWNVEWGLHSQTAPGQELPAAKLWRGELGFLQNSDFTLEDLEDFLLHDLGRAVEVFPRLKNALLGLHPAAVSLTTGQAYDFLRDHAKKLEQHGFTVMLPEWWSKPGAQFGLHLHVDSEEIDHSSRTSSGYLAAHQLLNYSWRIALGERRMELDEFRELVLTKTPLVEKDGQWIELNPAKLEATLAFLERQEKEKESLRFIDVLRLGLGVEYQPELLNVVSFSSSGWIKKILERDTHQFSPMAEPEGFQGSLRPYQREGLGWLTLLAATGVGGCLADDMGLGKTIQALALLLHERHAAAASTPAKEIQPTLLVVPMSILNNWEYEARRFAPALRVYVHHGPARLGPADFLKRAKESDVVITTYSLANRDEDLLSRVCWGRIILDEAQNIKNLDAKQTKAVKHIARKCMTDAKTGGSFQRLALTGTPLENHLEELWSIFDFLNPGFLGTIQEFRSRFALPIENFRNRESASLLNQMIRPFVLRRLKADPAVISDLPEKIEMEVFTTLTEEQASLYQTVLERMLPQIDATDGIHRKGFVLSTITRLKQICNHPALFLKDNGSLAERSGKLALLEEMLDVLLAEGDKVLVFTQFAQMGHLLKPYLQERLDTEVIFLHGGLSKTARDTLVARFRRPDGPRVFLLSLKAGGLGLNLTEANQVVHFDLWWNPAVQDQATDRAYRIGQTRAVQVRKFICKGTLEEKIFSMLGFKRDLMDQVVGATRNAILELSSAELRKLLELNPENIS